jgi:anti-anti-sigma regulatory factor
MVSVQRSDTSPGMKVQIEKFSDGPISCLRFRGTIDETFDGKKLAATVKAKKLILDLGAVTKISSFGVREWLSFISTVEKATPQIYLINCTPKAINQINMVANFVGRGYVFSFFAPYRCDECDRDSLVLLNVDRDGEALKKLKAPDRPCPACGAAMYLDEDPVSFFAHAAQQPPFELDGQVTTFLISKLNYAVSELARRIQCEKFLEGRNTYVKLVGNLDSSFPAEKLAEGLEGTIVVDCGGIGGIDPAGAAEFRKFLGSITPSVEKAYLIGCQPAFLLRCARPEDLSEKVSVLSFALPYTCQSCATTASQMVDVQQHFEVLKLSMPPQNRCESCGGATICTAGGDILAHLPHLPRPDASQDVVKFIKHAQKRKPEKRRVAQAGGGGQVFRWNTLLPLAVVVLLAVAGGVYLAVGALGGPGQRGTTEQKRPAWISSATPTSGYCTDLSNRTVCVGVSSYQRTKESAREEAQANALEALANTIGLRIENPVFRDQIRPIYADTRKLALAELELNQDDQKSDAFDRALNVARRARKQVAEALQKSGGDAVPNQIADWYWEEYKALSGPGTEFLVFVRYDVAEAQANALVQRYSMHDTAHGAKILTAFPSIGWRFPDVTEGAVVIAIEPSSAAQKIGFEERDILLGVGEDRVRDAPDFVSKMSTELAAAKEAQRDLSFLVKKGDGPAAEQNAPLKAFE